MPLPVPVRRTSAAIAVAALLAGACGERGDSVPKIELSQGSPDLTPDADDLAATGGAGDAVSVEYELFDGGTASTDIYRGRPLVVNFFAAWCPACISEMPDLEEVATELAGEVAFLGLSQDQRAADALELIDETGITYDVGWDPDLVAFDAFSGFAMPTTVFMDADGRVVEVFSGALTADALREKIAAIEA